MKKSIWIRMLLAALCLLLVLPAAAETREGVIMLEGMEEPIEETLFASWMGFSFWYVNDRLDAWHGERGNIEGVIVEALYSDDFMILSMIPEEDAVEYVEDLGLDIVEKSAGSRVQTDVYHVLEDGRYYFLTLIAEDGRYFRAVGEYSQEAAEGNAHFFQRVLDSVSFPPACPIRAEWGEEEADEDGRAQVILTAQEAVEDVVLVRLDWEDFEPAWEETESLGSLDAGESAAVTLEFIGDMPDNGILYTDEAGDVHVFALEISGEDGSLVLWEIEE